MNAKTDDPKQPVSVTLTVQQWQLDYSARQMTEEGYTTPAEFLQAVLNTALLRHIPEESWPPMSDEEKARLKQHLDRDDVDPDIPF